MTDVEQKCQLIQAVDVVRALLNEFGALTEYRTLRDNLPRRLARLLKCHCVLLYQRVDETLQFVAGSFDDEPGWSAALLAVTHINPISLSGDGPEACAWRERHVVGEPQEHSTLVALPLMYRKRGIGVMVVLRGNHDEQEIWDKDEVQSLDVIADVVALLLENTRLLERDRERIHELSLLNSISNQLNDSMYERKRLKNIVVQRTKEISLADRCALLEPTMLDDPPSWISPTLQDTLVQHFREHPLPLTIERPGDGNDPRIVDYLQQLPEDVKTFFAFPLLNTQETQRRNRSALSKNTQDTTPEVLGIIVGAYHRIWQLRREDIVLLQVLSNQTSAVLKNIQLIAEVVEARNEARKLLRQVLNDQRLKELILASIPSGLITTDREGLIVTFNHAAETILGHPLYEVVGQPLHKFLHLHAATFPVTTERNLEMIQQKKEPESVKSETIVMLNCQMQEVILDVTVQPLRDEPGEQIGVLIAFVDMTTIHRLEEEKRRLDRLAALGEMAANVAHEVRNPLASIKTAMQMLAEDLVSNQIPQLEKIPFPHGSELPRQAIIHGVQEGPLESIEVVLQEVERLDTIVKELLQFARPRKLRRYYCNIVDISDRVLHLLQNQCDEAGIIIRRMYEPVPAFHIDTAQMEQVFLNLYMNAIQTMPDGGILTIACHQISQEQALSKAKGIDQVPMHLSKASARRSDMNAQTCLKEELQWMELVISDTGPGIAPDHRERIFQPFFTTKAHGIGLGLAITRRLVEDHGGYIYVGGHFGSGATFSVRLPLTTDDVGENESDDTSENGKKLR